MNYDLSNAVTLLAIDCRNYQTLSIQCRPALGEPTTAVVEAKRAWGPSPTDPAVSFATAATLTLDGSAITEIDTTDTAWVHIVVTTAQAGVSFDMDFTTTGDMRGDVVEQRIDLTAAGSRSFIAAGRAASMIAVPEGAVSTGALEIKQAVASTYPTVAFTTAATLTLDGATVREIDTPSAGALIVDCTTAQAGLYAQLYAYIREEVDSDSVSSGGGAIGTTIETARYSLSASTGTISGTLVTLPYDRADKSQTWVSNSSGELTLDEGRYEITVDVTPDQTAGNNRTEFKSIVQSDATGSWVDIDGTDRRYYSRSTAQGSTSGSATFYLDVASSHAIRVQAQRVSGSTSVTCQFLADACAITITKLEDIGSGSALENRQGFADYNDAATASTPIALVADTWTTVTNDTLGAFTNTTYLPTGVSSLFSSNEIDVSDLNLGDAILIRYDFTITPGVNGAFAELRLSLGNGGGAYNLNRPLGTLSNGSGYQYQITGEFYVYMGDTNTRDNPIGIEAKCSENANLQNAGVVIQVIRK